MKGGVYRMLTNEAGTAVKESVKKGYARQG